MSAKFKSPENWTFETKDIAEHFDAHVREQLPWYELATFAARIIGAHYIPERGRVYDIGSGNGNMARAFADIIEGRNVDFVSIESSREMAKTFNAPGRLLITDACDASYEGADVVISFLAMIFISTSKRVILMRRIMESIRPGGAFILLERIIPDSGYPSLACARLTMAQKAKQGADPADIYSKEMSLIGLQRPMDPKVIESLGFVQWFRMGNFAGYIYEKPENP